jgi:hypothetical protein
MSRWPAALLFVVLFAASSGHGRAMPAAYCDRAAEQAERSHALPRGILAAIGRAESGRADATGFVAPWPWTIDAAGAGSFLPTRAAAVAAVRALQQQGLRNIDVGCFQVNLEQHPDAFASLQAAFDPQINADYAADFLIALRRRTGSWDAAVAAYHSAQPALGAPYRARVYALWAGAMPRSIAAMDRRPDMEQDFAGVHVWSPSLPGTAPRMIRIDARIRRLPPVERPTP